MSLFRIMREQRPSVPLLGFGNVLMKGVKEAVQEQGFLGLFAGGFKAEPWEPPQR